MPSPQYDSSTPADHYLPPVKLDLVAAALSYLIPGLGQVYQGRIGKGLLFFFGLYTLFFYGMWMGQWRNVWLPDADALPNIVIGPQQLEGPLKSFAYRPQFLGQFCIGIAAWPAVYQYINFDQQKDVGPMFGKFERAPSEDELNDLQRNGSKRWDLGWVYTVIAGVLNLLVIYDAFAGPMFRDLPVSAEKTVEITTEKGPTEKVQSGTVTPSSSVPSPDGNAAPSFTGSSQNSSPQRGNA